MNAQQIQNYISQCNGCDQIYFTDFFGHKFYYTSGVKFVKDNAQANWLIQLLHITISSNELAKQDDFLCITLEKFQDNSALVTITDGNERVYEKVKIPFTDFPLNIKLFYCGSSMNNKPIKLLMLPTEY
jgi:hypothetical protein